MVRTVEFRDITEQKEAEKEILHFHDLMQYIIEHDRSAVAVHDRDLNYIYVSQSYLEQYNVQDTEIIGKNHYEVFPDLPEKWRIVHQKALKGEVSSAEDDVYPKDDGTLIWTRWECRPWYEADGEIGGIVVYTEVINDRKEKELEIQKLNEELEDRVRQRTEQLELANKELEEFTYSVSHDLKAPLRGIDGYSKLLLELYGKQLDSEAKFFIDTIRSSTRQMNQLIEDLLQYSRLERSQLTIEPVALKSMVDLLLKMNKTELEKHHFEIDIDIPETDIIADPSGLQIALRNLIENAIKFSKQADTPHVSISCTDNADNWNIMVADNGVGFNMKYSKRIFEIFQRLHKAEDYPGTGIGLAMVDKAVQRMGGKVWAESEPGKGAVFTIEIPKQIEYDN
jgi:PAS domain S-box-containing protein